MTELPTPAQRLNITGVIDRYYDRMCAALDNLAITDEGVLEVLRSEGYEYEANIYQDWLIDEDPARDYREPNPPEGVVPDPPNPSYEPLKEQLEEMRRATEISYRWTERERTLYSNKVTVNRSQIQTWLNANSLGEEPEEIDAETLVTFLEDNPDYAIDHHRMHESEWDYYDLDVVETPTTKAERQATAFQMLKDAGLPEPAAETDR